MRLGAFLLGGVTGAAAIMAWQKNRDKMNMGLFMGTGNPINKAMNAAFSKGNGSKMNQSNENKFSNTGLEEVSSIVNEDPELKRQVDEIFDENHSNKSYSSEKV